jgi:hypothetical protein
MTRWFSTAEIDAFIRMSVMKGKGKITLDDLIWARKKFKINETERRVLQERMLWYLERLQGMVISYVKPPEEV